jgi:CRP-like cAMP-binding protein
MMHSEPGTLRQDAPHRAILGRFHALTAEDDLRIAGMESRRARVSAGEDLLLAARERQAAFFVVEGWLISSCLLPDGARQVLDCHVPGDIVGLRGAHVHAPEARIEALGEAIVAEVPLAQLLGAFDGTGLLPTSLAWFLAREFMIMSERLVSIGRRGALERTGHFLLELGERLAQAGLAGADDYPCPLSQPVLADALGLSAIHVNRTLRELRERSLLTFRRGRVQIWNRAELVDLCSFDSGYLTPTPESIAGHKPRVATIHAGPGRPDGP